HDFVTHTFFIIHSLSFFFNLTATAEIYTLSLHDALPILSPALRYRPGVRTPRADRDRAPAPGTARTVARGSRPPRAAAPATITRSEEHTSELQSRENLVCRLLLEKKK